jgi:hypothetical protein
MKSRGLFIGLIACLVVSAGVADARVLHLMSYQAMFDKSDLVIIAKAARFFHLGC